MSQLQALANRLAMVAKAASSAGVSTAELLQPQLQISSESCWTAYRRLFSSYAAPKPNSSLRRVNLKPGKNGDSAGDAAAAAAATAALSTSGQPLTMDSLLEMSKEVPGGSKPLLSWERWYWGVGVVGVSYLLYRNLKKPDKTPEEIQAAQEAAALLEVKRKEFLRAAIMGENFIEGEDDPLVGLSPKQIETFMEQHEIDPMDPLEGLTPEEIDAYVRQQEARRQQQ